ncbi:hypothetical protein D3C75_965910 [compost metagenome]
MVCLAIFSASLGCIMPLVRFSSRASRVMPSTMSSGSSTLPLDLDIFWPWPSRTRPCTYTVLNGTCGVPSSFLIRCMVSMIMRATQKKMMSKPVTSTSVEWNFLRNSVCSGQPRVENVHRPELNQVSSTSSS